MCDGLAVAHEQGVVHRDIKPGNVRVLEDGTVKLLDFGIATVPKTDANSGAFAGSSGYTSSEQLSMQEVDGRSDLFSVGVLAFELLTGRQPFLGESPAAVAYQILNEDPPSVRSLAAQLPETLEPVLTRALEKNPDRRWRSAQELGDAVRLVARAIEETPSAQPQSTPMATDSARSVGSLDLRVESRRAPAGDHLGDASLRSAGPAPVPPPVEADGGRCSACSRARAVRCRGLLRLSSARR